MPRANDVFLPVAFNRQCAWPGHRPGTRIRLQAILDTAAVRSGGLTLAERALLAACEFWSATATQSLARYLGSNPELRLRSLATIYLAMGAKRAARVMELALGELPHARSEAHRQQQIATLEVMLIRIRGAVEELLSRFAARLWPQELNPARRPTVVTLMPVATLAPRAGSAGPRVRIPVGGSARPAPLYVRWRTENHGAGQHD